MNDYQRHQRLYALAIIWLLALVAVGLFQRKWRGEAPVRAADSIPSVYSATVEPDYASKSR